MHELALTCLIFWIADRAAVDRTVNTIYLDVGVLRQAVSDVLDLAQECMSRQSENLTRSKSQVNLVSAVITCEECGIDTPIDDNLIFVCAICNPARCHMRTGEEPILTETDVP